jgi:hypothetical protein
MAATWRVNRWLTVAMGMLTMAVAGTIYLVRSRAERWLVAGQAGERLVETAG